MQWGTGAGLVDKLSVARLHRGAAWRKIACEFQCYMVCKGKSCSGNLDLSCAVLYWWALFCMLVKQS